MLSVGLRLLLVGLSLVGSVACERAEGRLSYAGGLSAPKESVFGRGQHGVRSAYGVDVRLQS